LQSLAGLKIVRCAEKGCSGVVKRKPSTYIQTQDGYQVNQSDCASEIPWRNKNVVLNSPDNCNHMPSVLDSLVLRPSKQGKSGG